MIVMMVTQPGPLALVDLFRPFGAGLIPSWIPNQGCSLVDAYRPIKLSISSVP
jgi:hypothetical protein